MAILSFYTRPGHVTFTLLLTLPVIKFPHRKVQSTVVDLLSKGDSVQSEFVNTFTCKRSLAFYKSCQQIKRPQSCRR